MSLAAPLQVGDAFADVSMLLFGVVISLEDGLAGIVYVSGIPEAPDVKRRVWRMSERIIPPYRDMIAEYEVTG